MDLRELGYFVAVYEERSVTAAARRCYISQPSVSAAIASLEHELDLRLFVRDRKGATPTSSADRLYPMARRLVDDARALKSALQAKASAAPVAVGLTRTIDAERTRRLVAAMARAEDVVLRIVGPDEPCDVRVVSKANARRDESFVPLWSERFVAALPATHTLAARAVLRSTDLAGERFVQRCHCDHARHLARGRRRPNVVAIADSEEWALALVAAGFGIAILPEGVVGDDRRVAVRALADVKIVREIGLARRGRARAEVERLVADVRAAFAR